MKIIKTGILILVTAITLSEGYATKRNEEITFSHAGKTNMVIVVGKGATEPEIYAANELATFLKEVTGAEFKIVNTTPTDSSCLFVGLKAARSILPNLSVKNLSDDGIIIRTVGGNLILVGGSPRGTLYAVYTFLEDIVGCRWWAPGISTIPKKSNLKIQSQNITYVPQFEYREPLFTSRRNPIWSTRNKCYGTRIHKLAKKYGTRPAMYGWGHTFNVFARAEKFNFKTHPEWHSEIKGKRTDSRSQLCLSNPNMRKEFIKQVRAIVSRPGRIQCRGEMFDVVWISQNDWGNYCQCKKCAAFDKLHGAQSASIVDFVNTIAKELQKDFPKLDIWTLAYQYSRKAPKNMKLDPKVVLWLCTSKENHCELLSDKFKRRIKAWHRVTDRIYIWDYVVNFSHYLLPYPNLRVLGKNIKFFAKNGVKGIMSEGASRSRGSDMADLKTWVLTKLYWNPSLDSETLINEFICGYYGKAAPAIKKYIDLIHDAYARYGNHKMGAKISPASKFLSMNTLFMAWRYLTEAESLAENEDVLMRVKNLKSGIMYPILLRWDRLYEIAQKENIKWPWSETIDIACKEFLKIKNRYSAGNAKDWMSSVYKRLGKKPVATPLEYKNLPSESWVDIQAISCRPNSNDREKAEIVNDIDASNGKAARINVVAKRNIKHRSWRQFDLDVPLWKYYKPEGKLRCKIRIKCNVIGNKGVAFKYGIYDYHYKKAVVEKTVMCKDITDNKYHVYDLGDQERWVWRSAWVHAAENPENIKEILIDRVSLIDAKQAEKLEVDKINR